MGLIILDREEKGGSGLQLRHHMRNNMSRSMRDTNQRSMRDSASMKDEYEEGYKKGYEEAWHDCMEECGMSESYRRGRDSQGRYV